MLAYQLKNVRLGTKRKTKVKKKSCVVRASEVTLRIIFFRNFRTVVELCFCLTIDTNMLRQTPGSGAQFQRSFEEMFTWK